MRINHIINLRGQNISKNLKKSYQASHITHNRQNIYTSRYSSDIKSILRFFPQTFLLKRKITANVSVRVLMWLEEHEFAEGRWFL